MLVTGSPYHLPEKINESTQQYVSMMELRCPIRDLGSAVIDLAYVAAGRFDGYFMPVVQPWDLAAGKLLIEEAGGQFTTYSGDLYTSFQEAPIVASNGLLQQPLLDRLKRAIGK
jgi:myo-inositol-1(or 4)-monophosphatase